eukprot:SAG11_NODE_22298_length_408_cov_1.323625_1_plen_38_part_10
MIPVRAAQSGLRILRVLRNAHCSCTHEYTAIFVICDRF